MGSSRRVAVTCGQRSSVLLSALSPALPAAMADDTSMGGHLATSRATQLVDIVRQGLRFGAGTLLEHLF